MRRLLDETFQGAVTFDPITVEPVVDFYGTSLSVSRTN